MGFELFENLATFAARKKRKYWVCFKPIKRFKINIAEAKKVHTFAVPKQGR